MKTIAINEENGYLLLVSYWEYDSIFCLEFSILFTGLFISIQLVFYSVPTYFIYSFATEVISIILSIQLIIFSIFSSPLYQHISRMIPI